MKCLNKEDKKRLIYLIINLMLILVIFYIINDIKRYKIIDTPIKVEVLSIRVQNDTERSMGKFRRDVNNIYISFKYKDNIYSDFKLGEEEEYNIKVNDIITLNLCEEYKDGVLLQSYIN